MLIIFRFVRKGLGVCWLSLIPVALLLPTQALAEKWYFEPSVSMQLGYDDNTQLTTNNEIKTTTSNITANATFGVHTEVSDVSIGARMVDARFDDHSDLNTNDQFLTFKSSFSSGLNQFGFNAGYDRVSTRTSEFDFTGFSTSEGRRITKSISPYWSRTLSERTSFKIDGDYSKADYEDTGPSSSLSNYTDRSVNASLQHQLTERSSLQAVVGRSLYKSPSTRFETTSIQLGLDYMFSETFSMNMLLGPSYTKSESDSNGGDEVSSTGKLINIGFSKRFELTTLSGGINSSESAGGEGKLIKNTGLNLSLTRNISDRTTFALTASVQQNESGGGRDDDSDNRTYVSFSPKLSWKASPWWTISGTYGYQKSEYTSSDEGPAESNAIYISMEYVWPREH